MKIKDIKLVVSLIAVLFLVSGCTAGLVTTDDSSCEGAITSYSFLAANNSSSLSEDVLASINGLAITATVPEGTDVTALIANYVTEPSDSSVRVGNVLQESAVTPNDFTNIVTYTVSLSSAMIECNYTVLVTESDDPTLTGVFVSAIVGNDLTGDGTKANPYKTIAKGITEAAIQGVAVRVGQGTYTISDSINIVEGVSLYGGYDESDDWSRDIATNISEIVDGRSSADPGEIIAVITGEGEIANTTVIDGFTIVGADLPGFGDTPMVILVYNGASPTISNNTIEGPTSADDSVAVTVTLSSNPVIINNTIDGGESDHSSTGLYINDSAPVIENNTISGGTAPGGRATGIGLNSPAGTLIVNNIIFTGAAEVDRCVREMDAVDPKPEKFLNNNLFGCEDALYSVQGDVDYANIAGMETYLGAAVASDNLSVLLTLDADFRIIGGPASVTEGGYDLSDPDSPFVAVPTDKDGEARSVPYSIGAYQY